MTSFRILVTSLAFTLASPALAQPPAPPKADASALSIGYSMAFWGIPFGHTDYDGTLGVGGYSAKAHFETRGVVSLFWKSTIDTTVNGGIAARSITPEVYDSYSQDRAKPMQRVKVTFGGAEPVTFADPAYDTTTNPVTPEQKKDTLDPMSAITAIFAGVHADAKNPCGSNVKVFDGRRRYDVVFTYLKDEPVKLDNGLFNGTAHQCQLHYNEIAGYKQKIIQEGKSLPPMFADFVEVPAAGAPNGHYVVAVKMWAEMSLGTVTVNLNNLKIDGAAPPGMAAKS